MSTDRELLELAAKAAGYEFRWGEVERIGDDFVDCTDLAYIVDGASLIYWDPFDDDGDALRLAVKLGIADLVNFYDDDADDPYAATRRAIVRAAAAIGEAMP